MSPDAVIALFGSTGLATIVGIGYQIVKERKLNRQKDLAGDLSLGELFRETARREVVAMQRDIDMIRNSNRKLREKVDRSERQIEELRSDLVKAEDYIDSLLIAWPAGEAPVPPLTEWKSHQPHTRR